MRWRGCRASDRQLPVGTASPGFEQFEGISSTITPAPILSSSIRNGTRRKSTARHWSHIWPPLRGARTMVDLLELLKKLETLEAPSAEIDKEIALCFGQLTNGGIVICGGYLGIADFTRDMQCAVRLCADALPGWFWRCGCTPLFPNGWAHVSRHHADHCDRADEASSADGKAANPAIALCIAVVKARIANPWPSVARAGGSGL